MLYTCLRQIRIKTIQHAIMFKKVNSHFNFPFNMIIIYLYVTNIKKGKTYFASASLLDNIQMEEIIRGMYIRK